MRCKFSILMLNLICLIPISNTHATSIFSESVTQHGFGGFDDGYVYSGRMEELGDLFPELSSYAGTAYGFARSYINLETGVMRAEAGSLANWVMVTDGNDRFWYTPMGHSWSNGAVQFDEIIQIDSNGSTGATTATVTLNAHLHSSFFNHIPRPSNGFSNNPFLGRFDFWIRAVSGYTTEEISIVRHWEGGIEQITSDNDYVSMTFDIETDGYVYQPFYLSGGMSAYGSYGIDAYAFNTGTFSMTLPEGFTYTSTSGVFLNNPAYRGPNDNNGGGDPTAPVPEPTTILLFGSGLIGLAAVGRRRRS